MSVNWRSAAFAGGVAGIIFSLLYIFLFGFIGFGQFGGPGILLGYGQSQKLIDVYTTLQPLPMQGTNLFALVVGNIILAMLFTAIYGWALKDLPGEGFSKGINFGLVLWAFAALWSALFTNLSLLGEPVYLILVEMIFWLVLFLIEGILIVRLYAGH